MTSHISTWKKAQLAELTELANQYPVIAIANLANFPASLSQQLRKKLVGKAAIRVSKTRVIQKALEASSIDSSKLNNYVADSVAVIFTSMNPFELYAFAKKNKGKVPAKEGDIAPIDIIVPAGDTGLPPGPALSDLKGAGLKVTVQGATISIVQDCVVTKKGEVVTGPVAGTLSKLDIKPMQVGLNIIACYENKEVYEAKVLDINLDEVMAKFVNAYTSAFNLAFNTGYFIAETIPLFISKAFREAKALALEAKFMTSETTEEILASAAREANALKAALPNQPAAEEKKEEAAEAPKEEASEEKAEEAPSEEAKEKAKPEAPEEEKPATEGEEKKE